MLISANRVVIDALWVIVRRYGGARGEFEAAGSGWQGGRREVREVRAMPLDGGWVQV